MNNVMRAFNQEEGETCILCGTVIHKNMDQDINGHPVGPEYLACHGLCTIMARGGREL